MKIVDDDGNVMYRGATFRELVEAAVAAGENLEKAQLSLVNMCGASLYCANLRDANLGGADFTGANMVGATGLPGAVDTGGGNG